MSEAEQVAREVRAARHQGAYREVNERLHEEDVGLARLASVVVCECADLGCAMPIEVPPAEYEAVRAHGDRFVVAHEHVYPEVEQIVETYAGYVVVEKLRYAAEYANAHDPRDQPG